MAGRGNLFSQDYPTSNILEEHVEANLQELVSPWEQVSPVSPYGAPYSDSYSFTFAHGWYKCESAQPTASLES